MNLDKLLKDLNERRINIKVVNNQLKITGNEENLTEELINNIKKHKTEIISFLKRFENSEYIPIHQAPDREYYNLSSSQKRLYILQTIDEEGITYNLPYILHIEGKLDSGLLETVFNKLVERHEILRTSFIMIDGVPFQKINNYVEIKFEYGTMNNDDDFNEIVDGFVRPFDLTKVPLLRVKLIKKHGDNYFLMIDIHHIIIDGVSIGILIPELIKLYEGIELPALKLQYRDYAEWQKDRIGKGDIDVQKKFWLKEFEDEFPMLILPLDYKRPLVKSSEGDKVEIVLDKALSAQLRTLTDEKDMSLFMCLLSILNILFAKLSNQEDIIIGTSIANRTHSDIDEMLGVFTNSLALRNFPSSDKIFDNFLDEIKRSTLLAYENQEYQFEELVDDLRIKRDAGRNPIFDVFFLFQNMEIPELEISGLKISDCNYNPAASKFDLMITGFEKKEQLSFILEYNTSLFKKDSILRFGDYFKRIISQVLIDRNIRISDIVIISETEKKKQLIDFNQTSNNFSSDKNIQKLIEGQADKTPNNIAVTFEGKNYTYKELNERSSQLAHALRAIDVQPGTLVAIYTERSIEMLVAVLGVLKTGGAYLPIDPEYPEERIKTIIEESKVQILLIYFREPKVVEFNLPYILDLSDERIYSNETTNPTIQGKADDLAFITYTSGSTGIPKGVMIEHRAILNLFDYIRSCIGFDPEDTILSLTTISFDIFIVETLLPLSMGMRVLLGNKNAQLDAGMILELMEEGNVSILQLTPSRLALLMANHLSKRKLRQLKALMVGGESFPEYLLKEVNLLIKGDVYNLYGPSETTVYATVKKLTGETDVTIGKPVQNTKVYILDKSMKLQPIGVPGELYISGECLARGYLHKPDLTKEKFIENPFEPGKKMYKTGDIVRWLPNGEIDFLGRNDDQVKIRGYRVELKEIERSLLNYEGIEGVVVLPRENLNKEKFLCAYIVAASTQSERDIKLYLSNILPDYMIPDNIIQLDRFPLVSNGKIDKRLLPEPEYINPGDCIGPRDENERKMVDIFSEVLGVEKNIISINSGFFDLGGHSLSATFLIVKIKDIFNVKVPMAEVFKHTSVQGLIEYIKMQPKEKFFSIPKAANKEYYALSATQKRFYFLQEADKFNIIYNMPFVLLIEGKVDIAKFEYVINSLVKRHEVYRTSFRIINDKPAQIIHEHVQIKIDVQDIDEKDIFTHIKENIKPFNLSEGQLVRFFLFRVNEEKYYLLLDIHHIIGDGKSFEIFVNEFATIYNGRKLEDLKISYKDFAEWQNSSLYLEKLKVQEKFWLDKYKGKIPELILPSDFEGIDLYSKQGDTINFVLKDDIVDGLTDLSLKEGTTLFVLFLTIYNIFLSKLTNQDDVIIGTPVSGRTHSKMDSVIGAFINILALRNYTDPKKRFVDFLRDVNEKTIEAIENQDYQFDELVNKLGIERKKNKNPLFNVMIVFQTPDFRNVVMPGLKASKYIYENSISMVDMTLACVNDNGKLSFLIQYNTVLFNKETIHRYIKYFEVLCTKVLEDTTIFISELEILPLGEQEKILKDFNSFNIQTSKDIIRGFFVKDVDRKPDYPAIVYNGIKLTYRDMDFKSNQLARMIQSYNIKPGDIIATYIDDPINLLINIFSILKAGATFIPLDIALNSKQIGGIVNDNNIKLLIVSTKFEPEIEKFDLACKIFFFMEEKLSRESGCGLDFVHKKNDICFGIITVNELNKFELSFIRYNSFDNLLNWVDENIYSKYNDSLNITSLSLLHVDDFFRQSFSALLNGHTFFVPTKEEKSNGEEIVKYLIKQQIHVSDGLPSVINQISETESALLNQMCLRYLIIGGDILDKKCLVDLYNKLEDDSLTILNVYGITECGNNITSIEITKNNIEEYDTIPIGKPIANNQVLILNSHKRIQPIGVFGELYIGGISLFNDFYNKKERCITLNYDECGNFLVFQTGDYGRWMPDGNIQYQGRKDDLIKIGWYRVNLVEIKNKLLAYQDIEDVYITVKKDKKSNKHLYIYYASKEQLPEKELKDCLKALHSEIGTSIQFQYLKEIPKLPNGDLNEPLLKGVTSHESITIDLDLEELENRLTKIWGKILRKDNISKDDDFFEIGGNSIKSLLLLNEINKEFDKEILITDIFELFTVRKLATLLNEPEVPNKIFESIDKAPVKDYYPIAIQQRSFFEFHETDKDSTLDNIPIVYEIKGKINIEKIENVFKQLIQRHESLRTSFDRINNEIVQIINGYIDFKIDIHEIEENDFDRLFAEYVYPFDLKSPPLLRVSILNITNGACYLFIDMHHIIADGTSGGILITEFFKLYTGEKLQEQKLQYKDFSEWQNNRKDMMEDQGNFWIEKLSGELPVINLPIDYSRPKVKTYEGSIEYFRIDHEQTRLLKELINRESVTFHMALLAIFNIFLHKLSGQEDIIVATPYGGRNHSDLETIVGAFINILPFRNYPSGDKTVLEFIDEVKKNALSVQKNGDVQYMDIVKKIDIKEDKSRSPLFDVLFAFQNFDHGSYLNIDIEFLPYPFKYEKAKFDLSVHAWEDGDDLLFSMGYNMNLFKEKTIIKFIEMFKKIISTIALDQKIKISDITIG